MENDEPAVDRALARYHCATWREGETRLLSIEIAVVREMVTLSTIDTPFERQRSITILQKFDCDQLDRTPGSA